MATKKEAGVFRFTKKEAKSTLELFHDGIRPKDIIVRKNTNLQILFLITTSSWWEGTDQDERDQIIQHLAEWNEKDDALDVMFN